MNNFRELMSEGMVACAFVFGMFAFIVWFGYTIALALGIAYTVWIGDYSHALKLAAVLAVLLCIGVPCVGWATRKL